MRVHVDVLKLRAQCARCGQIGHWAKECQSQNDPDGKGRSKGAGVQSEKSGFRSRAHLIFPQATSQHVLRNFLHLVGRCLLRQHTHVRRVISSCRTPSPLQCSITISCRAELLSAVSKLENLPLELETVGVERGVLSRGATESQAKVASWQGGGYLRGSLG